MTNKTLHWLCACIDWQLPHLQFSNTWESLFHVPWSYPCGEQAYFSRQPQLYSVCPFALLIRLSNFRALFPLLLCICHDKDIPEKFYKMREISRWKHFFSQKKVWSLCKCQITGVMISQARLPLAPNSKDSSEHTLYRNIKALQITRYTISDIIFPLR